MVPVLISQVAVFIIQKILSDEKGLTYMCATYDRFTHVANVLVSPWFGVFDFRLGQFAVILTS